MTRAVSEDAEVSTGPADGVLGLVAVARPLRRVLVFGALEGVADSWVEGPDVTEVDLAEATTVQLGGRFDAGVISAAAWEQSHDERRRALVHNLVAHLRPGGVAVIGAAPSLAAAEAEVVGHARACGLEALPGSGSLVFRRTARVTVHDVLADARSRLIRLSPAALAARLSSDPGCLVLDTRTCGDRARFGTIPGSRHVPRSTLEWRVDPFSGYSEEDFHDVECCLVVVCNDGYSSSLAAESLQRLGFRHATDLLGGFRAWRDAGLPVVPPDHDRSAPPRAAGFTT